MYGIGVHFNSQYIYQDVKEWNGLRSKNDRVG